MISGLLCLQYSHGGLLRRHHDISRCKSAFALCLFFGVDELVTFMVAVVGQAQKPQFGSDEQPKWRVTRTQKLLSQSGFAMLTLYGARNADAVTL